MSVRVVAAQEPVPNDGSVQVFITGNISDNPQWLQEFVTVASQIVDEFVEGVDITLLKPRRQIFPINDPIASAEQVDWESNALENSNVVAFWFAASTTAQPIVMFEPGFHARRGKQIVVGCDPQYQHRHDVVLQLQQLRPDVTVSDSLDQVAGEAVAAAVAWASRVPFRN